MIAYCGGIVYETDKEGEIQFNHDWRPKFKGKCGHKPLVIGKNVTCQKCLRLICDKCGFCDNICNEKRLEKLRVLQKEKLRAANARASEMSISCDDCQRWEDIPIQAYEQ